MTEYIKMQLFFISFSQVSAGNKIFNTCQPILSECALEASGFYITQCVCKE